MSILQLNQLRVSYFLLEKQIIETYKMQLYK